MKKPLPKLPRDYAKCAGVGEEGAWREGCEDCLRRLSIGTDEDEYRMQPPLIIAFFCEFHIGVDG